MTEAVLKFECAQSTLILTMYLELFFEKNKHMCVPSQLHSQQLVVGLPSMAHFRSFILHTTICGYFLKAIKFSRAYCLSIFQKNTLLKKPQYICNVGIYISTQLHIHVKAQCCRIEIQDNKNHMCTLEWFKCCYST